MFIPYSMPRFSLTGFGYSAILLGLFILLMAVNYNNNLLFTAVYFWFALLFTSGIRGLLQFVSLPDGRWTFAELFASNENQLQLCIDNDRFEGHLYIHGERDCIWRAHITDFGVQQLIAPDFVGIELLGLWRFRKPAPLLAPVCVYPPPIAHLPLQQHLQQAKLAVEEVDEISFVRPWQPDDSFRNVDWKSSARLQNGDQPRWICRVYGGDQPSSLCHLDWQDLSSLGEQAWRETLTAWVLELFANNTPWRLTLPELDIDSEHSYRHRVRCLQAIAGEVQR